MNILVWILLALALIIIAGIFFLSVLVKEVREESRLNLSQIPIMVKSQFEAQQNRKDTEFETSKKAVEVSIKGLEEQLRDYKQMMQNFEKDRDQKYGNLENELKNASLSTLRLQETTNKLNDVLGNVKLRGQWGERMAEDIIANAGLIENVNYRKQSKLQASGTQPDYTFILPDNHVVNMDVKFPLDNYIKMVNAQDNSEKEKYLKDFILNVKERVKEIKNRGYINQEDNTLDFVLIFIPNEQVFGVIHDVIPELMDDALKQKVVICSPFTLYAMLSIVRQAFENFRYEKDLNEIIRSIDQFSKIYDLFKKRFEKIGKTINDLDQTYCDMKGKSFKQLEGKIKQINDYKKGNHLSINESGELKSHKAKRGENAPF